MPKVKAIFYDLPDGSYPAQEFIDSLDIKMQAKMLRTIAFLTDSSRKPRKPRKRSSTKQSVTKKNTSAERSAKRNEII